MFSALVGTIMIDDYSIERDNPGTFVIRQDVGGVEIAALEEKLGIKTGKKERKKLNKEYASEGYDDSFGDWLYGLDDMVGRLANGKGGDYDDGEFSGSDASSAEYGDASSDGEEMLPMKDPAMSDEEEDDAARPEGVAR